MSGISIIGQGNMARAIAARAAEAGNAVEVIGDAARAAALAGDIVILAVPRASAAPVVALYGDALTGKVIVDITNAFNSAATPSTQEIARAAPARTRVVKAFNTVFGHILAQGRPMDVVLIVGDDPQAKATVSAFIRSLGLRPLDVGPLGIARGPEHTGLVLSSPAPSPTAGTTSAADGSSSASLTRPSPPEECLQTPAARYGSSEPTAGHMPSRRHGYQPHRRHSLLRMPGSSQSCSRALEDRLQAPQRST